MDVQERVRTTLGRGGRGHRPQKERRPAMGSTDQLYKTTWLLRYNHEVTSVCDHHFRTTHALLPGAVCRRLGISQPPLSISQFLNIDSHPWPEALNAWFLFPFWSPKSVRGRRIKVVLLSLLYPALTMGSSSITSSSCVCVR